MKRTVSFIVLLALVFTSSFSYAGSTALWTKYTSSDGSYSFHYPKYPTGWKVDAGDSAVSVENAQTDEELLMVVIPFDKSKSPTVLATDFINLLKKSSPGIQASNWKTDPKTKASQVIFDITSKSSSGQYRGTGIVIKENQQATWFSYTAPAAGYSRERGLSLLQGFLGSLASGSGSKAPDIDYNPKLTARIDADAQGFLFVLEFALGAPFTSSQEQFILNELKNGWRSLSEKELATYDQYPVVVKTILKMGQKDLEDLRSELEKTTRDWIADSPSSDKAVKMIKDQLQNKGKNVIAGDPPLTEMSLCAYSEIIAYSRLLRQNPKALPEQISQTKVKDIQKQVKEVWNSFSLKDRQDIATSPGLWICMRTLMKNGTKTEQDKIRSNLLKLSPETQTAKSSQTTETSNNSTSPAEKSSTAVQNLATHSSLMAIQQMTFNTYMWSRGFNYQPATGKMW